MILCMIFNQLYNTEKVIEDSRTNQIIQHSNSILAL